MANIEQPELGQCIEEVARQIMQGNQDVLAVMVRGSYVRRTMTTTSDVDLYAVTRTSGPSGHFRQHGSTLFHIRYLPFSYLQFEIRRCEPRYLGFVFDGRPVIDPSGIFPALQAVVASLPVKETLQRIATEGHHQHEDARGHLEEGNLLAALHLAREAALSYMQTFLLTHGVHCFKKKDVLLSFGQLTDDLGLSDLFLDVMGFSSKDYNEVTRIVKAVDSMFGLLESHMKIARGHPLLEDPPAPW